jgi:hypothetical protein
MTIDQEWLRGICRQTDDILWESFERCLGGTCDEHVGRVHFPLYRNGNRRFSEQEARFAFVHALESAQLPGALRDVGYAVENPTYEAYTFSGSGRSAATDLAIYESAADLRPTVNIEFKSGGFSDGRQSIDAVAKDVAKLVAERVACGLWFHLVKNTDAMTLPRVSGLLQKAFDSVCEVGGLKRWMVDESVTAAPKNLIVHLCVIEKRYSLQRQVTLGDGGLSASIALPRFPAGGRLPEAASLPGWEIHEQGIGEAPCATTESP